jgi:hypothetical protein
MCFYAVQKLNSIYSIVINIILLNILVRETIRSPHYENKIKLNVMVLSPMHAWTPPTFVFLKKIPPTYISRVINPNQGNKHVHKTGQIVKLGLRFCFNYIFQKMAN